MRSLGAAGPHQTRPERRGVSRRTVIEEAKAKVKIVDFAERLSGSGTKRGREVYFRCPLHDDRDPSLRVDPERGLWFCDPCLVGGDVVELARYVWGYEKSEVAMAAADLLREFGHAIPPRPTTWHAKLERQMPIRNGIEAAIIHVARRRLYKRFFEPLILATSDEEDRAHDEQLFWEATEPLAEHLVANMIGGSQR
jgi:DNA primase